MSHPSVVWSFSKNPGAVLAAPWPTAPAAARGAAGVALAGTPPALVRPTRSAKTPQKRPPPRRLWQRLHSAWRWLRPPLLCGVHVEAPAWFGFKRIQWKVETVESENKIVKIYQNGAVSCFFVQIADRLMARPIPITKDSSAPGFGGRFFCAAEGHLDWHNQLCLCFFSLLCLNFNRVQFQQIKTHRSLSSRSFGPKFCTIRHLQLFRLIAAFLGNRFSHVNP